MKAKQGITGTGKGGRISLRLSPLINERFERVLAAAGKAAAAKGFKAPTKTDLVEEAIEVRLPALERQYKRAA